MSDGATTTKQALYVGLAKWLGTVGLLVVGGIQIAGPSNTVERVTVVQGGTQYVQVVQSGAVTKVNGITHNFVDTIPLTMTGGKMNYDLAYVCTDDYGISGSGIVLDAGVMWIRNPAAAKVDIVYMKTPSTASGTANTFVIGVLTDNMTIATGSLAIRGTMSGSAVLNGSYSRWNGAECITVKSLTNPTSSGSGYLILRGTDDLSE